MVASCHGITLEPAECTWWAQQMNHVLREVLARPLEGKKVVLMIDDTLVKHLEGVGVLGAASTQTVILSFPQHGDNSSMELYHIIKPRKTLHQQT